MQVRIKPETRIAAELAALRCSSPADAAWAARTLCNAGRALRRIAENECNGWPCPVRETRDGKVYAYNIESPAWRARDEKRRDRLETIVRDCLQAYGCMAGVEFNHDPRGPAVKLTIDGLQIAAE